MVSGDPRRAVEARRLQAEWREDPPAQLRTERMPRRSLDDQAEDVVVRVRVRPARAGCEDRPVRYGDRDDLARAPVSEGIAVGGLDEVGVAAVVEEPTPVAEELADGDLLPVRHDPGQPARNRVVEREPALCDELEDDRGDERLRDAADAETVVRTHRHSGLQVPVAARHADRLAAVTDEERRTGDAARDDS